jgi:glutamate/aspartate transport system substrate-binding protein
VKISRYGAFTREEGLMKKIMATSVAAITMVLTVGSASAQELQGTMEKIKERGVITLGIRETSPPFSYLDGNNKPVGYSNDLCVKIADEVKHELNLKNLEVKFLPVNPQSRIPLLVNGTVDILCGVLTNTVARHRQVAFTPTIFLTGTRILARKDSGIKEIENFPGKSIALVQGTIEERRVNEIIEKEHLGNIRILNVKDNPEGVLALQSDRVDAFVSDDVQLFTLLSKKPELKSKFELVGRLLSFDPIALVIRRNDADFSYAADVALVKLFKSGEILDIYKKWFGPIGMPANDLLLTAFKLESLPD